MLLLSLVASVSVLRVDVDPLKGAEGRQKFAVVHALEDRDQFLFGEDTGDGDVVNLSLVIRLVELKILDNPKTAIWLVSILGLDQLLTD